MSPELGLALFVTLIGGVAVVWLAYGVLREHRGRPSGSSSVESEPVRGSQPSPHEIAALVGRDGFWVCLVCHSLNRPGANRCYACHAAMGSAGQPAPSPAPVGRRVPAKAKSNARSSGEPAGATIAPAAGAKAPPAPGALVGVPEPVSAGAPRRAAADVAVCPFLGFRDDPSTRCDYPDARNLCHATSKRGAALRAFPRRLVTGQAGTMPAKPIDPEHQKSRCLSVTHEQCARYPSAEAVAAKNR
jgi:hypothetical protein